MKIQRRYCILCVCSILLASCSSDDDTPVSTHTLTWTSCTDNTKLQCAELTVPMTYADTGAGTISIGLNRLPATGTSKRGSLLFNPGGPGGSGIDLLKSLSDVNTIPDVILEDYDLIGFDPRGVGLSTPVNCDEFGINDLDTYIADRTAIDSFVATAAQIATQCSEKHGPYLQHLGSLNVVRDMDEIRKALNEETLNFIGYSYGTRLAALYLQTFPENSGYIILYASVRPVSNVIGLVQGSLPTIQGNLEALLSQCARVTPDCNGDELLQRLITRTNLLRETNEEDEFELLAELVLLGTQDPRFGDFLLGPLTLYLEENNVSVLREFLSLVESQFGSDSEDAEDDTTAEKAILCADDADRPTADSLDQTLTEFNQQSDLFAEGFISLAGSCAGWPDALEPLPPIETRTAPASLLIGGTSDAQTPVAWSEEMATAIGGYFLTSEHPGHTVAYSSESQCVDELVTQFLTNGTLPAISNCAAEGDEN